MPTEIMADDEHMILQPEFDVLIRKREVVAVRTRMYHFPLHYVLGADGIELLDDEGVAARIFAGNLICIYRRAYKKAVVECVLERCRSGSLRDGGHARQT